MISMSNPTGMNSTPISTLMPASPGSFNFGNTANPGPPQSPTTENPYAPANSTFNPYGSTPSMNPGTTPGVTGVTSTGGPTGTPVTGVTTTPKDFSGAFGGAGSTISGFLNSSGGYNSALTEQAVNAQIAAMQQQIGLGAENLETNLAESGISPNSSVSALEMSNYESQATAQENAITAQEFYNMWNTSMGNETSIIGGLLGPEQQHAQAGSFLNEFDQFAQGIGALNPVSVSF